MFCLICLGFQGICPASMRPTFIIVGHSMESTTVCQICCIRTILVQTKSFDHSKKKQMFSMVTLSMTSRVLVNLILFSTANVTTLHFPNED